MELVTQPGVNKYVEVHLNNQVHVHASIYSYTLFQPHVCMYIAPHYLQDYFVQ